MDVGSSYQFDPTSYLNSLQIDYNSINFHFRRRLTTLRLFLSSLQVPRALFKDTTCYYRYQFLSYNYCSQSLSLRTSSSSSSSELWRKLNSFCRWAHVSSLSLCGRFSRGMFSFIILTDRKGICSGDGTHSLILRLLQMSLAVLSSSFSSTISSQLSIILALQSLLSVQSYFIFSWLWFKDPQALSKSFSSILYFQTKSSQALSPSYLHTKVFYFLIFFNSFSTKQQSLSSILYCYSSRQILVSRQVANCLSTSLSPSSQLTLSRMSLMSVGVSTQFPASSITSLIEFWECSERPIMQGMNMDLCSECTATQVTKLNSCKKDLRLMISLQSFFLNSFFRQRSTQSSMRSRRSRKFGVQRDSRQWKWFLSTNIRVFTRCFWVIIWATERWEMSLWRRQDIHWSRCRVLTEANYSLIFITNQYITKTYSPSGLPPF